MPGTFFKKQLLLPFITCLAMLVLVAPSLIRNQGDLSNFIIAGDQIVDGEKVPVKIKIRQNSGGYDGQFYFRLALNPDAHLRNEDGVTFDAPTWRMQRIGYPVIVHLLAFGKASAVPALLFLVNFFGIGLIAWLALRLSRQLALPDWLPLAIVSWPGLVVTLVHDTTEITALVFLLAALSAYFAGRYVLYAGLAAAATLSRETSILIIAGIFLYNLGAASWGLYFKSKGSGVGLFSVAKKNGFSYKLALLLLALIPFLLWRQFLIMRWGISPQADGGGGNVSWPFAGFLTMIFECITGARPWAANPLADKPVRAMVFFTSSGIMAAGLITAVRLRRALSHGAGPIAIGWLLLALLMSMLSANGPWIDSNAYFRAFTEFWALSMVILAASRPTFPKPLIVFYACTVLVADIITVWRV